MAQILLLCTGNISRSPMAEALLRRALEARLGDAAPSVASAGLRAESGRPAVPEAVEALAERGLDLSRFRATRLTRATLEEATVLVGMAREHVEALGALAPEAASRTFTLKELVRLLEALPSPSGTLAERVAAADAARRGGFAGHPEDEDVADPLGLSVTAYRAVAWELESWLERLAEALTSPPA